MPSKPSEFENMMEDASQWRFIQSLHPSVRSHFMEKLEKLLDKTSRKTPSDVNLMPHDRDEATGLRKKTNSTPIEVERETDHEYQGAQSHRMEIHPYSNIPGFIAEHGSERFPVNHKTEADPYKLFNYKSQQEISDNWGLRKSMLTYCDQPLFAIYDGATNKGGDIMIEALMQTDMYRSHSTRNLEGQEVMLVYIPRYDMFISGWDATESGIDFEESEVGSSLVFFRIDAQGCIVVLMQRTDAYLIYETGREQGFYAQICHAFPDGQRIDIRLD